jgi:hypothetical protein
MEKKKSKGIWLRNAQGTVGILCGVNTVLLKRSEGTSLASRDKTFKAEGAKCKGSE